MKTIRQLKIKEIVEEDYPIERTLELETGTNTVSNLPENNGYADSENLQLSLLF